MKKIGHILTGWAKAFGFIKLSSAEAKLSELRLKVCIKCEYSKKSDILRIVNGDANYENRLFCDQCKCPCLEKSLIVDEACPVNRW